MTGAAPGAGGRLRQALTSVGYCLGASFLSIGDAYAGSNSVAPQLLALAAVYFALDAAFEGFGGIDALFADAVPRARPSPGRRSEDAE